MNESARILVVDDDPAILVVLALTLRLAGHQVWEAATGTEALRLVGEHRPALVLLDVVMPGMDGFEVCRQIKAKPALIDVFVVLCSGLATAAQDKCNGLATGADEYLAKPVGGEEFLARIRTLLRLQSTTAALRASEQKYRQLVDLLPDGVGLMDLEGRLTAVNQRGVQMLGHDSEAGLIGKSIFKLLAEEDRRGVRAGVFQDLADKILRDAQFTMRRRDGSRFPAEASVALLKDSDGQPLWLVGVVRDITERKHAEQLLAASLELNRAMMTAATVGILAYRAGGGCVFANEAAGRILRTSVAQLLTENFNGLSASAAWQTSGLSQCAAGCLAGKPVGLSEFQVTTQQGLALWLECQMVRFMSAGEPHLLLLCNDISDRKQAQKRLAEALELNRTIMAASIVGIAAYKATGECVFVNEALAKMMGGEVAELLKQNFRALAEWREAGLIEPAEAVLATGRPVAGEYRLKSCFGWELWVDSRFTCFTDNGEQHLLHFCTDITGRKEAESVLRESEQRFRTLFESAPIGIALHDAAGRYVHTNRAYQTMVGYQDEELRELGVRQITYPADVPEGQRLHVELRLGTRDQYRREKRYLHKLGHLVWARSSASALRQDDGELVYIISMVENITEHKRTEESLEESRRLQRAILDTIPDPAWLKDAGSRFLAGNQALAAFYGKTLAEIRGSTADSLLPAVARDLTHRDAEVLHSRQPLVVEDSVADVQGRRHCFESIISPVVNSVGEVTGTVGIARDITLRKEAEAALKQSEKNYRELVQNANSIILRWNRSRAVTFLNEFGQALFGYTDAEIVGRDIMGTLVPEIESTGRPLRPMIEEIYAHPAAFERNVNENIRQDGSRLWVEWTHKAVFDDAGLVVEMFSVGTDITERRRLEQRLLNIVEEERQRVGRDLHDSLGGRLAGAALMCMALVRSLTAKSLPEAETAAEVGSLIKESIAEARSIAHGLCPVEMEGSGLLGGLQKLADNTARRFGIVCKFEWEKDLLIRDPAVAYHLFRIVEEAIGNAIRHGMACNILIRLAGQGGQAALEIWDDGLGLPADLTRRTGMGLRTMKYRADMIGAQFAVERGPDVGTVVTCRLPLVKTEEKGTTACN